MKRSRFVLMLSAGLLTLPALAHDGVKNPAVLARMHTMLEIGSATKVLGDMAKGATAFDAGKAQASVTQISIKAATINELFEANEDDPKSEALPAIWTNFEDFAAKADALKLAADSVGAITSLEDVKTAMPKIGATCSACHKSYRE